MGQDAISVNASRQGCFRPNSTSIIRARRGTRTFEPHARMARFGRPEELVGVAVLLSSDAASFLTAVHRRGRRYLGVGSPREVQFESREPHRRIGFVAVIRAGAAEEALRIAEACLEGGATIIENHFSVRNAAAVIQRSLVNEAVSIVVNWRRDCHERATARTAIQSGAQFLVSPALIDDVTKF